MSMVGIIRDMFCMCMVLAGMAAAGITSPLQYTQHVWIMENHRLMNNNLTARMTGSQAPSNRIQGLATVAGRMLE